MTRPEAVSGSGARAVIPAMPVDSVEANPWLPAVFEIVATDGVSDAQVTCVVRLDVEPSV